MSLQLFLEFTRAELCRSFHGDAFVVLCQERTQFPGLGRGGEGGYSCSWEAVLAFANIFCSFVHIWKRHTVSGTCLAQKQSSPQSSQTRGTELCCLLRQGQSLRAVPFPPDAAGALITVHYCYECL